MELHKAFCRWAVMGQAGLTLMRALPRYCPITASAGVMPIPDAKRMSCEKSAAMANGDGYGPRIQHARWRLAPSRDLMAAESSLVQSPAGIMKHCVVL